MDGRLEKSVKAMERGFLYQALRTSCRRLLLNINATGMFDALVVMSQRNHPTDTGEKDV